MTPFSLKEIYEQRPRISDDGTLCLEFYSDNILLVISMIDGTQQTAPAPIVARVLSRLKDGGYRINNLYQVPYSPHSEGVMATIIDYEYVDD